MEKAPDGSIVTTITLPTSFLSKSTDRQAEVDIHEGQHGVDDKARGRDPFSFAEFLNTETNAYTVQSYVMMGLDAMPGNGLWDPTWGADAADKNRRDAIKKSALDSARKDCSTGGCGK